MVKFWLEYTEDCEFPIENLPYGVFKKKGCKKQRCGVAIGNYILDLKLSFTLKLFKNQGNWAQALKNENLNKFMALGNPLWLEARKEIRYLLQDENSILAKDLEIQKQVLIPIKEVKMCLPAQIGDYTDFYSSEEHATNVGIMFRGTENALQPNWKHLPVGYHGRSSSIVVSETLIKRPNGQLQKNMNNPKEGSIFSPCKLLDFELEIGCFIGPGNKLGNPIDIRKADNHIFGFVLMNDWSARDIQKWEYVPLGPFTSKNFATTISPWIVTLEALKEFKCETSAKVQNNPIPLPYLIDPDYRSLDIRLSVELQGENMNKPHTITKSNYKNMYWNYRQQLVHHSITGCPMNPGDLLGSGTISGKTERSYGSMLELSWKGTKEIQFPNNETRKFLKNGDTVNINGYCQGKGYRIGFGDCKGKIFT